MQHESQAEASSSLQEWVRARRADSGRQTGVGVSASVQEDVFSRVGAYLLGEVACKSGSLCFTCQRSFLDAHIRKLHEFHEHGSEYYDPEFDLRPLMEASRKHRGGGVCLVGTI